MKKAFLLSALIIPMVIGCNKNSAPNFDEVFPNDEYKKVGFKIADDEKTTRALTALEISTVENTVKNIAKFDKYINKSTNEVHERSYLKAFAGEYSQGMNVKNVKNDRNETRNRYDFKNDDDKYHRRLVSNLKSTSLEQYGYGSISKAEQVNTYLHEEHKEESINDEIIKLYQRVQTIKGSGESKVEKVIEKDTGIKYDKSIETGEEFYVISQKDYIKEVDIHTGANNDGQIIMVKEEKNPYPGEKSGYIKLKDEREYCALNNSISVAKLQLIEKPKIPEKWQTWENDWYIVNSVRKYTETVITSDVIQPNVPISYLNNPIVISYIEERQQFFVKEPQYVSSELPPITPEDNI